jgi:translocation and assembly module TamB
VVVNEIGAEKVHLRRWPQAKEPPATAAQERTKELRLPQIPPVSIRSLSFPHIRVSEELLGQAGVLKLTGTLKASQQTETRIDLSLSRTDRPGLRASLQADFRTSGRFLKLDGDLYLPSGGLLDRVLPDGLPRPLGLSLNGTGSLAGWPGRLRLTMAGQECLTSRVHVTATSASAWTLQASGRAWPGPHLPARLSGLLEEDGTVRFDLRSGMKADSADLILDRLELSSSLLTLDLSGELQPGEGTVAGRLSLEIPELSRLPGPQGQAMQGGAHVSARFHGHVPGPSVQAEAVVSGLSWQESAVERAELRLDLKPDVPPGYQAGQLEAEATINGIRLGSESMPGPVDLTLAGDWDASGLNLRRVDLQLDGLTAKLQGRLAGDGSLQAQLGLDIPDLGLLQPISGTGIRGGLDLAATVQGDWKQEKASVRLQTGLTNLSGLGQPLAALIGSDPRLQAQAEYSPSGQVDLGQARLRTAGLVLAADGRADLVRKRFSLAWNLVEPFDLAVLSGMTPATLSGRLSGSGQAQGGFERFGASVVLDGSKLATEGFQAESSTVRIDLEDLPDRPNGRVQLSVSQGPAEVQAQASLKLTQNRLSIDSLRLTGPQTDISAEADWPMPGLPSRVQMHLVSQDLTWLQELLPQTAGLPKGQVDLSLNLDTDKRLRVVKARLQAEAMKSRYFQAKGLKLTGRAELDGQDILQGAVSLEGTGLRRQAVHIQSISFSGSGSPGAVDFKLQARGSIPQPFSVAANGQASFGKQAGSVSLASGKASYGGLDLSWQEPLQAVFSQTGISLDARALRIGQGRASILTELTRNRVQADISLNGLALAELPASLPIALSGQADLRITADGRPTSPRIELNLHGRELRPRGVQDDAIAPAEAKLTGGYANEQLRLSLDLSQGPADLLQAALTVPMQLSLRPFTFQSRGQLDGRVDGGLDLSRLDQLVPLGPQDVSGSLTLNLMISGQLESPRARGRIVLDNGRYQNIETGTLLEDIQTTILLQGEALKLQTLQATDGGDGRLEGQGRIDLDPSRDVPFQLSLSMKALRLIRLDRMEVASSGSLDFSGDLSRSELRGRLTVGPAELRMPEVKPKGLQGLRVIETGASAGKDEAAGQGRQDPEFLRRLHLDLQVDIPSRFFVRGRGLDSEWTGEFRVRGTAAEPSLTGQLQVRQGRFDVLTKRFSLSEGSIQFTGQSPPLPFLELTAVHEAEGLLVRMNVSGPATEPEVSMSSEPPYPRDEILSRLLFDRELSEITAVQAVQLALAVKTLTMGDERGFMDKFRDLIMVDRVEVSESETEEDGTVVGVGKYLGEDVYFEVEQDIQAQSGSVTVEIELSDTLSLQTEVGDVNQGVGLTWSYSY